MDEGFDRSAGGEEHRPDTLRCAELMTGDAECIDAEPAHVEAQRSGSLHRIGVHRRTDRVGSPRNRRDGLHGADLVIGIHDADERAVRSQRSGENVEPDQPIAIHCEASDLESVEPLEIVTALKHGWMLDSGRDDVATARMGERDAGDREIRSLRAAGGEHDL